jgi:hypothetical protein
MKWKITLSSILAALVGWFSASFYSPEHLNPGFIETIQLTTDVVISPQNSNAYGTILHGSRCKQNWAKGSYRSISCTLVVDADSIGE